MNTQNRSSSASSARSSWSWTSFVLASAAALTLAIGWFGLGEIERRSRRELASKLSTTVDTNVLALRIWLNDQRSVARSWAAEPGVRGEIVALARSPAVGDWDRNRILSSDELRTLRSRLGPVCHVHHFVGFLILDAQGRQIGALLDAAVGETLPANRLATMRQSWNGETTVTPPFPSSIPLPDEKGRLVVQGATMLVMTPVYDEANAVAAVLAFRLRPENQLSEALTAGRSGSTGETYLFDRRGRLLSESRFDAQLRQAGLLPNEPHSRAMFTLDVRDPGGNVTTGFVSKTPRDAWPLTRMATSAVAGEDGVDVIGYRDYRGVPVVGAWRWLPDYDLGVTHETDVAEALAPWHTTRFVFSGLVGSLAVALIATWTLQRVQLTTERKRMLAQESLVALARQFQMVLDSATQVSIIATDMQGQITIFNTGAERMLGYSADEVVGKLTPATIHLESEVREHGERLSREFGRPIQGFGVFVEYARHGGFEEREWTYVRKDGSRLTVNLVVTALADAAGQMSGFLGIAKDVTEHKLVGDKLREAVEAAEAANRAKSEFLANMSHEIRTPMNAIMGMTELVLDSPLTALQHDYLTTVLGSAESLLEIINEILDFSKIEAGKLQLVESEFDLREELGDALKSLGQRAASKQLELTWTVDPAVPDSLVGDPVRVRQIVINLVSNGIKFTHLGEVDVEVAVDEAAPDWIRLRFVVRDTGIGIPPEKMKRIFVPFEQGDGSTTRLYGGTGLGLTISLRLVSAMQGRLWVESTPGKGSEFHFTAVFGIGKGPQPRFTSSHRIELQDAPVLVVDDNATNRRILFETLNGWGMKVHVAENASQAVEWLEAMHARGEPLPLVLTDVHMPVRDGFMLVESLRASPTLHDAVVIMLTSGGQVGDTDRCAELRIAGRLLKPVKQSELFKAIVRARTKEFPPVPTASATPPQAPTTPRRQLHVLLAEDSLVNQKLAHGLLAKWGHRVVTAGDGQETVQRWDSGNFDVILMDVQMPVMDGLQATREIRRREQTRGRRIPIIAVTARAMTGDRELCLAAGMDAYISKPIMRNELEEVLSRLFPPATPESPDEPIPRNTP